MVLRSWHKPKDEGADREPNKPNARDGLQPRVMRDVRNMPTYSHSRLSTLEACPRKYWFSYIEKPNVKRVPTVEAFWGMRLHEALQTFYARLQGDGMSLEELVDWYETDWNGRWSDEIRIVRGDYTADDYLEVGRESLRKYYGKHHPFDGSRTHRLGGSVIVDLRDAGGEYVWVGFIDRLSRRGDGVFEIHDYKTSWYVPTQEEADNNRQSALYQIGVEAQRRAEKGIDHVWHCLRSGKELRSRRTSEQLEAVKRETVALIDEIESRENEEAAFPPRPSGLCGLCEYKEICLAARHHVPVDELPAEEYNPDRQWRI